MAKKHFDNYVKQLEEQLEQFKDIMEKITKEAQEGMTDIDFMENIQKQTDIFEANYERVMYLKMLLDRPAKKEKAKKYDKQMKVQYKELDESNSLQAVLDENQNIIDTIDTLI